MIIDGLIPYITFGGVLLYEARMEGVLGSKKTTSSIAAVVPVDFDRADDAATTRAAVRRNKFEAKDLDDSPAASKSEQAASV